MYKTADDIFRAMCAIVEAPGYPLLKHYKDDLYTIDRELLASNWCEASRAIWVVTPNGTHLSFVGHHARQIDDVKAMIYCGYSQIEIYRLHARGIQRITAEQALEDAKKLDFQLKVNEVTDALGNTIAHMSSSQIGFMHNTKKRVHFEPGIAFTGSHSQLLALRIIANQASIVEARSLFVAVDFITVGDAILTKTGLFSVPCNQGDKTKCVIYNPKEFENDAQGFLSFNGWSTLSNATHMDEHNARMIHTYGSTVVSLYEARLILAQHQLASSQ